MAKLLWGKVYYQDTFAGFLRQEPGMSSSFVYDSSYLQADKPAIAYNLPLQVDPHLYQTELPPFFDNLVAEGWLEKAQSRLLGKRIISRFELLLAFGLDCAGAVSVIDPNPEKLSDNLINSDDPKEVALLSSNASLSGIQPKLAITEQNGVYYPATAKQLSTHIAKFPSSNHYDLVANEYLTMLAFNKILPEENIVDMQIGKIVGFEEEVLLIKRFDRDNGQRIHFEEFNQLLDYPSNNKYFGSYEQIGSFIQNSKGCISIEAYRLLLRILAGILLGNTDMHLKNFAMLYTSSGLRLTPVYDQVSALQYGYKQLALTINKKENLSIFNLSSNDIIALTKELGLNKQALIMALKTIESNILNAKDAITNSQFGSKILKEKVIALMDTIWNKTYALIGTNLLKKQ